MRILYRISLVGLLVTASTLYGFMNSSRRERNRQYSSLMNIQQRQNTREYYGPRDDWFLIDTSGIMIPDTTNQFDPAIAYNGSEYLAVWADTRGDSTDIYCTLIASSGNPVSPSGIAVSYGPGDKTNPMLCFGSSHFLAVWQVYLGGSNYQIVAARVTSLGNVVDTNGINLGSGVRPSVAFDGTNYIVVWRYGNDIYGKRISPSGTILDPAGIPISTAAYIQDFPDVKFDGTNYFVVWEDNRSNMTFDIYGAHISPSGTVYEPLGIPISTQVMDQRAPSMIFDGTNYFVTWYDGRNNNAYPDIYGARLTPSGILLDSSGIAVSTANQSQYYPSISFDGVNYFVLWQDSRAGWDIYGARVTTAGNLLDSLGIPICAANQNQMNPHIAFDGTNHMAIWDDGRGSDLDIYCARILPTGSVIDTLGILVSKPDSHIYFDQFYPAVAFDGANYLVVWEDIRAGEDIYGARITSTGIVLDSLCFTVYEDTAQQSIPTIAFDGTNYLVVWMEGQSGSHDIKGARVSTSGIVIDSPSIAITQDPYDQLFPSVAFDGTNYLVVWDDNRYGSRDIFGTRISSSGILLDPTSIEVSIITEDQSSPSIAFDGTNYLVIWDDRRNGPPSDIYGSRVSTSGIVLDPYLGIAISTANDYQLLPSVSSDGTNYLAVWSDRRNGGQYQIYGARIAPSGNVLDPSGFAISSGPNRNDFASVCYDGMNYTVTWVHYAGSETDIHGAVIDTAGLVVDTITVSQQPGDQFRQAIAHGSDNQVLIAYECWTDTINTQHANVKHIWGRFCPLVGISEGEKSISEQHKHTSTIFRGSLQLPESKTCRVFDITGRVVEQDKIQPGIYFIEVDGVVTQKVVKVR